MMNITLRKRKQSKTGKISLYLDIYKGTATSANGKTKYLREYEYLNLYLVDKPKSDTDKKYNKETLSLAESIRSKRELELKSERYGFNTKSKNTIFLAYFDNFYTANNKNSAYYQWQATRKLLVEYAGDIRFSDITERFCEGFANYLQSVTTKTTNRIISAGSVRTYWTRFSMVIYQAVKDRILQYNPCQNIKLPTSKNREKVFLTLEEFKKLIETPCKFPALANAFLFSCLTGLRWSDVSKLTWMEVIEEDDKVLLQFRQQKTKELNYLPLPKQAITLLGERQSPTDKVFPDIHAKSQTSRRLVEWALSAGIAKKITFHSARHTFAVLQLSHGTGIYTVQRLLGHSSIASTMVYANIVDAEKDRAMERLEEIL